ncbi:hypothetical protein HAX54_046908 [Datura stramonium]|uniref:Uncharacterized protein n=1 Tax=Datura stramonium TaxID=4076 RepID=A0ABS8SRS5_DATST|nr:hypothetical protein [Datura stramonium]
MPILFECSQGDSWKSCSLSFGGFIQQYLNNSCVPLAKTALLPSYLAVQLFVIYFQFLLSCYLTIYKYAVLIMTQYLRATESQEKVGKEERSEDNNIDVPDASHPESVDKSTKNTTIQEVLADDKPKTVNAFQRVKIDQVEFKDDRLKDNSYWAKDGADIGYGAKAPGFWARGFKHEKQKK